MKKRSLTVFLALTLLLSSFASCANDTPDPADTTATETSGTVTENAETEAETVDPASVLELPETNWEGKEFCVLGQSHATYPQFSNFEINVDEITGEGVNDAVYNRNRGLEAQYNVIITQDLIEGDGANVQTLRTAAAAGEQQYDAAFFSSRHIGPLASENLLYDLNMVEHIDFSKNWWSPVANESLSIANKLFFTTSDFALRDKNRTYIMVYNKDMVKNNNLEDPMDLVRNSQWTLDKVGEMATAMGRDLDGNGTVEDSDQFGFAGDSSNSIIPFIAGCGYTIVSKNEDDIPILCQPKGIVNVLDAIMPFWENPRTVLLCEDWTGKVSYDKWYVANTVYNRGDALFMGTFPHALSNLSAESENDYGVLPFPKYTEDQERYYSIGDGHAALFCIPTTTTEPEFSGFMLEALSAASTDTTLKAYIEVSCKSKYVYDADSAEMLDLIFNGIIFDQATVFGISGVSTQLPTYGLKRNHSYASDYARLSKMTNKSIDKLVEKIQAAGEREGQS